MIVRNDREGVDCAGFWITYMKKNSFVRPPPGHCEQSEAKGETEGVPEEKNP